MNQQWGFGPTPLSHNRKQTMPIDRANKPYDPSENKPGATGNTAGGLPHQDHDDGPFAYRLDPPPKPGVGLGLLLWTLAGAAITFTTITLWLVYR